MHFLFFFILLVLKTGKKNIVVTQFVSFVGSDVFAIFYLSQTLI